MCLDTGEFGDTLQKYKPGDVAMVQPRNLIENCDEFVQFMELDPARYTATVILKKSAYLAPH